MKPDSEVSNVPLESEVPGGDTHFELGKTDAGGSRYAYLYKRRTKNAEEKDSVEKQKGGFS